MKIGVLVAVVLVLSLGACSGNSQNSSSQNSPAPVESTNPIGAMATAAGAVAGSMANMAPHSLSYALRSQNASGEVGKVTLVGTGSKTTVTISLNGENTTGKQPAHIHVGPCSKLGAVKYPLSDVVLGKSVTIVGAPLGSLTSGSLAVNVHESATDLGKYVSCGDLSKLNVM